jgi:hypothetical protein
MMEAHNVDSIAGVHLMTSYGYLRFQCAMIFETK